MSSPRIPRDSIAVLGTIVMAALSAGVAAAGQGALPPVEVSPRSAEAWAAAHAQQGRGFTDVYPEHAEVFAAAQRRMPALAAKYAGAGVVLDQNTAMELARELYVDNGHPALNARIQSSIVEMIGAALRAGDARCTPAARTVLSTELLRYSQAGGGRTTPAEQAVLARALALGDERSAVMADELMADAHAWATEVRSDVQLTAVTGYCVERWGEAFLLDVIPLPALREGEEYPKAYRDALERIRRVLEAPAPVAREHVVRVREAVRSVEDARIADDLRQDLIGRLLIALRTICERRPAIGEQVFDVVADGYARLLRESLLNRDEHWRSWERGVIALGERRTPESLKRAVARLADDRDAPQAGREAADRLIRQWEQGAEVRPRH